MVDRATVAETTQVGLEATPGTAVAADTALRAVNIKLNMPGEADTFRPDGRKFVTVAENNMEWTSFDLSGKPTYTEICWPLAAMFGNPAPVATSGTYARTYEMPDTTLLNPKTLTIEKGGSVRAERITYGLLTSLGFTISRSAGLTLTGDGIGQLFTDGITMTAAPDEVPLVPVIGKQWDIYIDADSADLGTTKMLRAFRFEPNIGNVFGPIWPINSSNTSFGGHVDLAPTTSARLQVEADAAGMAYLSDFRAGNTIFLRAEALGPVIASAIPYRITIDLALKIKRFTPDEDEAGVKVATWETEFTKDSTWGRALQIEVVNDVATVA